MIEDLNTPGENARHVEPPQQLSLKLAPSRGYYVQGYLEKLLARAESGHDAEPTQQGHLEPSTVSPVPETKLEPRIRRCLQGLAVAAAVTIISATPAAAHRDGGFFFGLNVGSSYGPLVYYPRPSYYYGPPPVYYVPPPVYYPPRVYYAPPPPVYYPPPAYYYPYRQW